MGNSGRTKDFILCNLGQLGQQAKVDAFVKRVLPFVELAPAHGQGHFDCDTD